ncbi:hypothetical protein K525DRAFT_213679 [Schizophyllum commune Loenen D]|nr:hypothetical protein K525DRAFT_213679 [Schizophyllum commune Loenen D]
MLCLPQGQTRRKRKRSITVEPSCIFDTSPTAASDETAEKDDSSIAVEDDDGPLVDELASPKDSDPLTIEAFLQRSSAARTKTYRGRHKRRRVHFAESDHDYAPPEDDPDEAEDQLGEAVNNDPDEEPLARLASSPSGSSVAAPPRKKKKSLSHRLTMSALECGGTVPVEPELPPRIPLISVAANGTTKPPKRPRKTGHLVDPRRRTMFERSISHFRAAAAQRAAAAASPSRSAATLLSRAAAASSSRLAVAAKPRYRPKWRTHAPPMLPRVYFPSRAAESILPPPGKKPHRRQAAHMSDTIPLKLVPLEESVVGAKTKNATGRPGRRMTRKKGVTIAGPAPLTFVSVLTRNVPTASASLPTTDRPSSPPPTFCMSSVRDRLLGSCGPPRATHTDGDFTKTRNPEHDNTASPDATDLESPPHAGSASPFSSKAASNPVFTSTAKNALSSTSKHPLSSSSKPAPFSAFKTPLSLTTKIPLLTNTKTPLRINANTILSSTTQSTHPSSTKPLKPLAAFHDRLAETVRAASQLVDAATGVLQTPEGGSRRRKRASEASGWKGREVLFPAGQYSLVPASDNVYAGVVCSWCSTFGSP